MASTRSQSHPGRARGRRAQPPSQASVALPAHHRRRGPPIPLVASLSCRNDRRQCVVTGAAPYEGPERLEKVRKVGRKKEKKKTDPMRVAALLLSLLPFSSPSFSSLPSHSSDAFGYAPPAHTPARPPAPCEQDLGLVADPPHLHDRRHDRLPPPAPPAWPPPAQCKPCFPASPAPPPTPAPSRLLLIFANPHGRALRGRVGRSPSRASLPSRRPKNWIETRALPSISQMHRLLLLSPALLRRARRPAAAAGRVVACSAPSSLPSSHHLAAWARGAASSGSTKKKPSSSPPAVGRLLIANRGEIACRILKTISFFSFLPANKFTRCVPDTPFLPPTRTRPEPLACSRSLSTRNGDPCQRARASHQYL